MKKIQFTAIYSTEFLKDICYSFRAESVEAAISFASRKFRGFPNITIVENDESDDCKSGKIVFLNGEVKG